MNLRDVLVSLTENNETIKRMERRLSAVVAFSPLPDKNDITEWKLATNEHITYNIEKLRWQNEERISKLKERLMLPEFDRLPDKKALMDKLDECRKILHEKNGKVYADALKQLRRNPTAKSVKYQEALELLRSVMEKKK